MDIQKFESGDSVTWKGRRYDFAYYSRDDGWCVLYEEGCQNMQDSFAVRIETVEFEEHKCKPIWYNINGLEPNMDCEVCGRDLG